MKKQIITSEGPCGITIEMSIIDQYRLTDELAIIDLADAEMKASADWEAARNEARNKGADWEERNKLAKAYDEANPAPKPTITPDRLQMAHQNILKFVRKFALEGERKSNIFED
jgi:hypothetical protein